jgi:hypothetical protein
VEKPDATEQALRFGCGFIFGLVLGLTSTVVLFDWNTTSLVMVLLLAAAVGLVARHYGDRFWHWFGRWWEWLWPW